MRHPGVPKLGGFNHSSLMHRHCSNMTIDTVSSVLIITLGSEIFETGNHTVA